MSEKRIVQVTFLDHAEVQDVKLEEVKKALPVLCTAYGELIAEGENHITVLTCFAEDEKDSEPQNHAMVVVKKAIVTITDLTPKEGENLV